MTDETESAPSAVPEPGVDQPEDGDPWYTSWAVPIAIVAIAVGLIAGIVLVAQQDQGEGRTALGGTTVEPSALPVTVPFREIAGHIVIDVTFGDDSRTVPMILDSGAPTIVSEEIAEVFGGGIAGTVATTTADGGVITSDVVPLPKLTIGEAVFRTVGAVIDAIEPGNPFYCISDSGFIGASLMQAAVWQIDPASGNVTIAQSVDDLDHIDDAIRLDFARASDVSPSPLVELSVRGEPLTFLLDTGSDGWLAANATDLNDIGIYATGNAPTEAVLGTTAAGGFTSLVQWLAAEVTLGEEAQRLPIATVGVLPEGQGNAGTDFLSRFVVTFDWSEDAVYLDPIAELAPTTPSSAGLAWSDGYVVGSYVEGLPGNEGLALSTEVTAIDGRDVTHAPFDDFCTRLTAEGTATYEMTVAGEVPTTVVVAPVKDFFEPLLGNR